MAILVPLVADIIDISDSDSSYTFGRLSLADIITTYRGALSAYPGGTRPKVNQGSNWGGHIPKNEAIALVPASTGPLSL